MNAEIFREELLKQLEANIGNLQDKDKAWIVKGFIDIYKNVYTIFIDTKVISKIIELMLFPIIARFAQENGLEMILAEHQNHYPDISFLDHSDNSLFALDIKSTYKLSETKVNGFTLGAFTGYFRNRDSTKNITFPYSKYNKHFVLGVIYKKQEAKNDEKKVYSIDQIDSILSVISDFEFILHEKYRLAISRPGSGNTKNIGSTNDIEKLKNGDATFSKLGIEIFDDYWRYYLTKNMSPDGPPPYCNIKEYLVYKNLSDKVDLVDGIEDGLIEDDKLEPEDEE